MLRQGSWTAMPIGLRKICCDIAVIVWWKIFGKFLHLKLSLLREYKRKIIKIELSILIKISFEYV